MSRFGLFILLAVSMPAFTQSDPDLSADAERPAAAEAPADPCAEPESMSPEGVAKPAEEVGKAELPPQISKECAEFRAAQARAKNGTESATPEAEQPNGRPDEGDFIPDEEISEDYPVPLPSDI